MKVSEITNSITTLPKVGPAKAALFARLNIFTVSDLLQFYPRDYEDRTQRVTLFECLKSAQAGGQAKAHTIVQATKHDFFGFGNMRTLKITVTDGTAQAQIVAFNRPWLERSLKVGSIFALTGTFFMKFGELQTASFDTQKISESGKLTEFRDCPIPNSKVFPIYRQTEGLTSRQISATVEKALEQFARGIENELDDSTIETRGLLQKRDALQKIHLPQTLSDAAKARETLVYEELFTFQKIVAERAVEHRGELPEINPETGEINVCSQKAFSDEEFRATLSPRQKQLLERIPFTPTADQKSVIAQMNIDIDRNYSASSDKDARPFSMRALLQGDVGSGKTLVSFFAALRAIDYGSQCALMAPTELLARQHAENAAKMLESLNVRVAFLTGNMKAKGRNALLSALKSGEVDFVIGTHALFSKSVEYRDLSLAIIDEQHKFGVLQRSAILEKGRVSRDSYLREPNLLMMSATPIPQTLALTVFGDLDVLSIRTMPGGRKPIKTFLVKAGNEANAYEAVRAELKAGRQAYFVYPAIEQNLDEGESADGGKTKLKSAEEMFEFLKNQVYPEFGVAIVHGKVSEEEQSKVLDDFKQNRIQVLVATTVVEVGVDVPNATCIVIEQADRFGLAGLHQLRGRVGRGDAQSYCFLVYRSEITEDGKARMRALHDTNDGFVLAEEDLKLRGPGQITGTAQSGDLEFKIADPVRDQKLMIQARFDAFKKIAESAH